MNTTHWTAYLDGDVGVHHSPLTVRIFPAAPFEVPMPRNRSGRILDVLGHVGFWDISVADADEMTENPKNPFYSDLESVGLDIGRAIVIDAR